MTIYCFLCEHFTTSWLYIERDTLLDMRVFSDIFYYLVL